MASNSLPSPKPQDPVTPHASMSSQTHAGIPAETPAETPAEAEVPIEAEDMVLDDEDISAAAEMFDGDDDDPLKFIEKSMHYQDLSMTLKEAEERVEFFTNFAKTMPKSKNPTARISDFEKRRDRARARKEAFEVKYAKRRVDARKQREKRNQQSKDDKQSYDLLSKPLKTAISKTIQKSKLLASKAAIEAQTLLPDDASEKAKTDAGLSAFVKTFGLAFEGVNVVTDDELEETSSGDTESIAAS